MAITKTEILNAIHKVAMEGGFETDEMSTAVVKFAEKEIASLTKRAEKASAETKARQKATMAEVEFVFDKLMEIGQPIGATALYEVAEVHECIKNVQALTYRLGVLVKQGRVKTEKVKRVTMYSIIE